MKAPTMSVSTNPVSRPFAPERHGATPALLFGAGALLAFMHQAFDLSIGVPGHFGIVWMAVMVLARCGSTLPHAALAAACGYAGTTTVIGPAHAGLFTHMAAYGVVAVILDYAWRAAPSLLQRPFWAAVTGGAAFAVKPLLLIGIALVVDVPYGALRHGALPTLFAHSCFGATGAALGAMLWVGARDGGESGKQDSRA